MKLSVYIETTVVSYLTARKSASAVTMGHQESTRKFWLRLADFDSYVSDLVLWEAGRGDKEKAHARLEALAALPIIENAGYIPPEICTPEELLRGEL